MNRLLSLAVAGALVLGPAAARAGVVTETYTFAFNGFTDVISSVPAPIKHVSGSFTLTFDPAVFYDNDTTDIVVNYLHGPVVASTIGFDNFPAGGGSPGFIAIGGIQFDADFISVGTDDVTFNLKYLDPAHAVLARCSDGYACGSAPGSTIASGYTLSGHPDSAWLPSAGGVPEPSTWAMLLLGFGALGLARRRAISRAA
jgi:hypothetical protein